MLEYVTNKVDYGYDGLDDAFPPVEPGVEPLGSRVLVQLRSAKTRTKGGIILTQEVQETDQWNTQVAMIRAIGPLSFRHRDSMEEWKEGAWCNVGDFVRVPKYGGDRWSVKIDEGGSQREVLFILFNDLDLIARVNDPLAMRAFI